ncbi:MAG: type I-A CRISPR-associated protein Cas5a [Ignisphaera sp.]
MAELVALIAKLRGPSFSVKQPEAFQIGVTLPLPQPSTLAGALAYCIAVREGLKQEELATRIQTILKVSRACFLTEVAVPSSIVLKRFRALDKVSDYRAFEDAYRRFDYEVIFDRLEKLTDALYREYVFTCELLCVWIVDKDISGDLLWSINHLGDTESLCSVIEIDRVPVNEEKTNEVKTRFQAPIIELTTVKSGAYKIVKMYNESFWYQRKGEPLTYAIPCEEKIERGAKGFRYRVYRPTEITILYDRPVNVYSFKIGEREESLVGV